MTDTTGAQNTEGPLARPSTSFGTIDTLAFRVSLAYKDRFGENCWTSQEGFLPAFLTVLKKNQGIPVLERIRAKTLVADSLHDFEGAYRASFGYVVDHGEVATAGHGIPIDPFEYFWASLKQADAEKKRGLVPDTSLAEKLLQILRESCDDTDLDAYAHNGSSAPVTDQAAAPPEETVVSEGSISEAFERLNADEAPSGNTPESLPATPPEQPQDLVKPDIYTEAHLEAEKVTPLRKVGPYEILEEIGHGGMSIVYRAYNSLNKTYVAIKVIKNPLNPGSGKDTPVNRFLKEAELHSKLDHPNIVRVLNVFEENSEFFIVMELVEGTTLFKLIEEHGRMTPEQIRPLGTALALALQAGLACKVIHRDLKPENVLVSGKGTYKLADFGIALSIQTTASTRLTERSVVLGTPGYMSPEQINGFGLDHRSDIYGLGALLYNAATDAPPGWAPDIESMMHNAIEDEPARIGNLVEGFPTGLESIIHRCLKKDRDQRYQTYEELLEDLESSGTTDSLRHQSAKRAAKAAGALDSGKPRRLEGVILAGLCIIAILIAAWLLSQGVQPNIPDPDLTLKTEPVDPAPEAPNPDPKADPTGPEPEVVVPVNLDPPEPKPELKPEPAKPPSEAGLLRPIPPHLPLGIPEKPPLVPPTPLPPAELVYPAGKPTQADLDFMKNLFEVSRETLPERRRYQLEGPLKKYEVLAGEATPWAKPIYKAELERIREAATVFEGGPKFEVGKKILLTLRDGRELYGTVEAQSANSVTHRQEGGLSRKYDLSEVSAWTFDDPSIGISRLNMMMAGAGEAAPTMGDEEWTKTMSPPHFPGLADQSIEEAYLQARQGGKGNSDYYWKSLATFKLPAEGRSALERLFPARLRRLDDEVMAASLYTSRQKDASALPRLLENHQTTIAGIHAAKELLADFRKRMPEGPNYELVGQVEYLGWNDDTGDARGGTIKFDFERILYVLSVPDPKARAWMKKPFRGAAKGYTVLFTFSTAREEGEPVMALGLSASAGVEITPSTVRLFQNKQDGTEANTRSVELAAPSNAWLVSVVPLEPLILVYLVDQLVLVVESRDFYDDSGIKIGAGGGTVTIENIRVADRTVR